MPPNETTVLLTNYREKRILATPRTAGYGIQNEVNPLENSMNEPSGEHIVNVSKDPSEYEPIFSIEDYSSALTLAELLPFQDDPWWQKFRRILFLCFWLTLLMTFASACILSNLQAGQLSCQAVDPNFSSSPATLLTSSSTVSSAAAITTAATNMLTSKIAIMST